MMITLNHIWQQEPSCPFHNGCRLLCSHGRLQVSSLKTTVENFLFIFDFSISNGYLGNLVMMLGPQVFFQENIPENIIHVLRWPRFEMNRSELPPCWSPFLFLASALAPSCPIPSWTLCDKNLQDLAFRTDWGFAAKCSPTQMSNVLHKNVFQQSRQSRW